jgi:FKBP-type peptidyl-prolyl cis-trans isomerase
MNITTTGIAVAAAVVIVAVIFIFPGLSPFAAPAPSAAGQAPSDASLTPSPSEGQTQNTMTTPDGLQITDTVVGTGATLAPGDTVEITYTGMLADGTVFDSSEAHGGAPLTLTVAADGSLHTPDGGGLIPGWSEGVVGMKAGGTRTLVIPPALGYGAQGIPGVIPANATLTFELQLLSVSGT